MTWDEQKSHGIMSEIDREMRKLLISFCAGAIALMALGDRGWAQTSKNAMEPPCESFNRVLGYHDDSFAPVDDAVRILTTGYSSRSGALYQRFIVTSREAEFIGLLQLYPSSELLRFGEHYEQGCVPQTHGSSPLRDFTNCRTELAKEIDLFFGSQSERLRPENVVTKELSTLDSRFPGDSRCDAFAVQSHLPLEASSDSWRVFLRNYRLGRRLSTGTHCDVWDQEDQQLLFYEAFVPSVLNIDGKTVMVDEQFPGVLRDDKFQHVCELSQAVQSYAIDSKALTPAVQKFGNLCSAESGSSLWSCQVSRNILIGNQILKNTVERPNLTPHRLPPAPSVWPRAN